MSHFVEIETDFKDLACLKSAILEVMPNWVIEEGESLPLKGYGGDDRSKKPVDDPNYAPPCVLKVSKKHIGNASNDIGVSRTQDGKLAMHISVFDARYSGLDTNWVNKVKQQYQIAVIKKQAKRRGHRVTFETKADGRIVGHIQVGR